MVTALAPPKIESVPFYECPRCGYNFKGRGLQLTDRHRRILALVAQGYSNKMVAGALNIQLKTVRNHMTTIIRKTGGHNRTSAVVIALEQGLIRKVENNQ